MNALARLPARFDALASRLTPLAQLALRIALALPFLRSGLTRWDGFGRLSEGTVYLFREEFRLHVFGAELPFPAPVLLAHATGIAELLLPALLLLGLGTRLAALGLLLMTGVIQLTFPDGWTNFHLYWAAMALALVAGGAGTLSADHLLRSRR